MDNILRGLAHAINNLHDFIISFFSTLGVCISDKDMHFWLMGIIGIVIFLVTDAIFKRIARWSVSIISFVYAFTVLMVIVFALEIEQGITGSGIMEFADIVAGIWGFLVIFGAYLGIRIILHLVDRIFHRKKTKV